MHILRSLLRGTPVASILLTGCGAPGNTDTAASPVVGASRSTDALAGMIGVSYDRRADDGVVVAKVSAKPESIWDAVSKALVARRVPLTIFDRPSGRMGDTALVLANRWNGQPLSQYLWCGSTFTGPRADSDRIRAVLLAQLSRLRGDTIAVAIHLSGTATPLASGNSGSPAGCTSTGRAETELLDDVIGRLGGMRRP